MTRARMSALALALGLVATVPAQGADPVSFGYYFDDEGRVWVDVENDPDRDVVVTSVVVSFYDAPGALLEKKTLPCTEACGVGRDSAGSSGPIEPPKRTAGVRPDLRSGACGPVPCEGRGADGVRREGDACVQARGRRRDGAVRGRGQGSPGLPGQTARVLATSRAGSLGAPPRLSKRK